MIFYHLYYNIKNIDLSIKLVSYKEYNFPEQNIFKHELSVTQAIVKSSMLLRNQTLNFGKLSVKFNIVSYVYIWFLK